MKPQIYTDKHRCKKRFINKKSVFICVSLWLIIFAFDFQSQAQTYTNPVIPGDFPDPSVIRVGSDYYATATTGDWSPNFPILHSTDLVNWKIVGAVFIKSRSGLKEISGHRKLPPTKADISFITRRGVTREKAKRYFMRRRRRRRKAGRSILGQGNTHLSGNGFD